MRLYKSIISTVLLVSTAVYARSISSEALLTCMKNSQFTASSFDVTLDPDKEEIVFDISAISTIDGNVTAKVDIIAYGITIISQTIDPCKTNIKQLCPLQPGHFDISNSTQKISKSVIDKIPGIAYAIPDLDGIVQVQVYDNSDLNTPIACVEATLSNGKTVQTKYASWGIGAVCALGLLTAGGVSAAGFTSTAAHIASNTVSLFVYFQSVAMIAMMAVERCSPIAAAWAENFMWTMGLIRVSFMQTIFNWYVQATGGTVTDILPNKDVISISVQKRDVTGIIPDFPKYSSADLRSAASRSLYRAVSAGLSYGGHLAKRASNSTSDGQLDSELTTSNEMDSSLGSKTLVLRGMQRVAFLSNIELTSLFLTGLAWFLILGAFMVLVLALFKGITELMARSNIIHQGRFSDYRRGWLTVTKGVLFRLVLIGFPQLSVLCLWELTRRDSVAIVVVAVLIYVMVAGILGFAAYKVISIARRSMDLHKNPAYILFSDPASLNRWGFLYIQFRATAYYFIVPVLIYSFIKAAFIGLAQSSGKAQAMGVFLIELAWLIGISWLRPYMDKKTNALNISCAVINFINALFFLFFSQIFGQPAYIAGVMGVVFFILNAVFSLVLLIMIIVSCVLAFLAKNPDNRYQPMRDDRESFIRDANVPEKNKMTTELDALGATARDGYEPNSPYASEEFASSARSLDGFPQARLPRRNNESSNQLEYAPSNPYSSFNSSAHNVDSYSPERAESPGFPPPATHYQGYMPTPTDNYNSSQGFGNNGYSRQPPRF